VPVGTVTLPDFDTTDCLIFIGHNTGVNAPRLLHPLQDCAKRGVPIIIFNPLRERGFERFTNPQNPIEMLSGASTPISSQYHQIHVGGDKAALIGVCKALFELDDAERKESRPGVIDHAFIAEHTYGFEEFEACARGHNWAELEIGSGLNRSAMEAAATVYARAKTAIIGYGMGMTQHVNGVENVQMVVNLLLMRGNIGKRGAGVLPIRGHSNVQGQHTVGITEKPDLVPNDKLKALYGFDPPKDKGLNCTEAAEAIIKGEVRAMVQLGGNLVRSLPDHDRLLPAWRKLRLTVQIETKLNKSCLVHGDVSYILPCLGRIEIDRQNGKPQAVSVEDSTACIHGSRGYAEPASTELRSEPWIIAALAKAMLPPNPKVDWDGWIADYSRIRDAIERTYSHRKPCAPAQGQGCQNRPCAHPAGGLAPATEACRYGRRPSAKTRPRVRRSVSRSENDRSFNRAALRPIQTSVATEPSCIVRASYRVAIAESWCRDEIARR
jgi:molybdopterin-dependent oxidoreductase alpha subunit